MEHTTLPEKAVVKRKPGHPRSFSSPADLESRVAGYFEQCEATKKMPTKSGLAIFFGISRDTLNVYEKESGYSDSLKRIYAGIEEAWVQRLAQSYPVGSIFYLKNMFAYADKSEQTTNVTHNVFFVPKEIAEKHGLTLPEAEQHG